MIRILLCVWTEHSFPFGFFFAIINYQHIISVNYVIIIIIILHCELQILSSSVW